MKGIHINSDTKHIFEEAEKVYKNGGNCIQLFVNISKSKDIYEKFNNFLISKKIVPIVHASYTINIAQEWNYHSWWVKQLITEIEFASIINSYAIVIHLGKKLNIPTDEEVINNMFSCLLYVHNQTKNLNVKILLETSSGQGSETCFTLEKLAHFFRKFSNHNNKKISNRFGLCIDTCHIFQAGYDIRNKILVKTFLDLFDELIGIKYIKLIHLNDSKNDINLHLDRHENINLGFIKKEGLLEFITSLKNVPVILETPYNKIYDDLNLIS